MPERRSKAHGLTPKQLELRRTVMGGTDAAAILGVSRYRTAWDVFADKMGWGAPSGEMSEDAMWGLLLEDVIREEYARRVELAVHKPRRLVRHRERRWQAGHVDGRARDRGLEIKVRGWQDDEWGEPGSDEVPADVRAQVEHYLAVTGLPSFDVAVLFRAQRLAIYTIAADPAFLAELSAEEGEWWQRHVVEGAEPDYDGDPRTTAILRRRWPTDSGRQLVALPHQYPLLDGYAHARSRREFYEHQEELHKQQIMAFMEDAAELVPDSTNILLSPAQSLRITYRRGADWTEVDWQRYAADLEGLVEQMAVGELPIKMDPLEVKENLKSLHSRPREGTRTFRVSKVKSPQIGATA